MADCISNISLLSVTEKISLVFGESRAGSGNRALVHSLSPLGHWEEWERGRRGG